MAVENVKSMFLVKIRLPFACDLLGSHNKHYPRHSIRDENFFDKSVEVFKRFIEDVNTGSYPSSGHIINMAEEEYKKFLKKIR